MNAAAPKIQPVKASPPKTGMGLQGTKTPPGGPPRGNSELVLVPSKKNPRVRRWQSTDQETKQGRTLSLFDQPEKKEERQPVDKFSAENVAKLFRDNIVGKITNLSQDEKFGAMLLIGKARQKVDNEIDSSTFVGKTLFSSRNSLDRIRKIVNSSMSNFFRKWEDDGEKRGAEKALNYLREQLSEGKPAEKPSPQQKQPWEMTSEEFWNANEPIAFKDVYGDEKYYHPLLDKKQIFVYPSKAVDSARKKIVQQALKDGKSVPKEVLADYPELKKNGVKKAVMFHGKKYFIKAA